MKPNFKKMPMPQNSLPAPEASLSEKTGMPDPKRRQAFSKGNSFDKIRNALKPKV